MRRGRQAHIDRPPPPPVVKPGMTGGTFKPLSDHDIQRIHTTVLDVLENIGIADPIEIVKEHALKKGCRLTADGRLCYPRSLVEDIIASTPKDLVFYGRDPKYDLELGGERVHTYGGGEAVTILEIGTSNYRSSTLRDVYDAARLVDRLDNIHAFSRLVVATEFEDQRTCDINTAYASVAGTRSEEPRLNSSH